jgi:hypothetical protein
MEDTNWRTEESYRLLDYFPYVSEPDVCQRGSVSIALTLCLEQYENKVEIKLQMFDIEIV